MWNGILFIRSSHEANNVSDVTQSRVKHQSMVLYDLEPCCIKAEMEPNTTKHSSGCSGKRWNSSYTQIIHREVNIPSYTCLSLCKTVKQPRAAQSCSFPLKQHRQFHWKYVKTKQNKVGKAFTSRCRAWHHLHHKVQQSGEKLECACFIVPAKPRIKQRITSRWCPFLHRFFSSTLFWNL